MEFERALDAAVEGDDLTGIFADVSDGEPFVWAVEDVFRLLWRRLDQWLPCSDPSQAFLSIATKELKELFWRDPTCDPSVDALSVTSISYRRPLLYLASRILRWAKKPITWEISAAHPLMLFYLRSLNYEREFIFISSRQWPFALRHIVDLAVTDGERAAFQRSALGKGQTRAFALYESLWSKPWAHVPKSIWPTVDTEWHRRWFGGGPRNGPPDTSSS